MTLRTNDQKVLGVILAGGTSRRMNHQHKYKLLLDDKSILDHIIECVTPQVEKLVFNSHINDNEVELGVIPDIESGLGPMGGIYASMIYAKKYCYDKVLTVPSDTPFLPKNLVSQLLKIKDKPIVVASSNDQMHPTIALWDLTLIDDLKVSLEQRRLRLMSWVSEHDYACVHWDEQIDPFFNINTPDDLIRAKKLLNQQKIN